MTSEELQKIAVTKGEKSTVTLTGEIPFTYLEKQRAKAVAHIGKDVEIDGFRKGHVPEKMLIARVGEMALLSEMAERALSEAYPKMVAEHQIDVVGYPQISITKLAPGNPLGFTLTVAVMPGIELPDYQKIAQDINSKKASKEVTDAEIDMQIAEILRQKMAYERLQEKAKQKAAHTHDHAHDHEHHDHDHAHDHDHSHDEPEEDYSKLPLPELTDEYVKALGKPGQFESVVDFKEKIKEHLTIEKAQHVDSEHRAKITDAIVEKSTIDIPDVMIDAELNQMFAQMESDLSRAQLTMEGYLEHVKKTKDDLKKEWTPAAEKRAKLQLVLNEIAKKEHIEPDQGAVDQEVSKLIEQYADANEARVRIYVESVLRNDAVMKKLEDLK